MKNKKLFAILTLVCFMFTLMPVAAFAAAGDGYVTVNGKDTASVKISETNFTVAVEGGNVASANYYYFAIDEAGDVVGIYDTTTIPMFTVPGVYDIYAVEKDPATTTEIYNEAKMTKADKVDLFKDHTSYVKKYAELTVKAVKAVYDIDVTAVDVSAPSVTFTAATSTENAKLELSADGGYDSAILKAAVSVGTKAVEKADVKFATNGYGVKVTKLANETDRKGEVKFTVSATVVGDYKIYVTYGDKKEVIDVHVNAVKPADVTVVAEPTAPVDVTTQMNATGIGFKLFDANGNAITTTSNLSFPADYKVSVVNKPADSALLASDFTAMSYDTNYNYWVLNAPAGSLSEEGDYTFKVTLPNGATASASVTVKEFDDDAITGLKLIYNPTTAGLNDTVNVTKLFLVDANGVQKNMIERAGALSGDLSITGLSGVEVAANGAAVSNFDSTTGAVTIKADEKYIGSTITVFAVYEDYTASAVLTVVEDATTLAFNKTTADVAVTNTLVADVVDSEGNKVDLNAANAPTAQVIVLEKPENALVAATAQVATAAADKVNITFTPSAAGEYKIQVIVKYQENIGTVAVPVLVDRYISAIETITVGGVAGQFNDVVVISLGANAMIVNNEVVKLDVAPYIENSRTMLQYNVLGAFGVDVQWVGETQSVVAEGKGIKVVMTIGSKVAVVNGAEVALDVAPQIVNGRTVVPVGFITGTFGINPAFTYNADGSIADIIFTAAK